MVGLFFKAGIQVGKFYDFMRSTLFVTVLLVYNGLYSFSLFTLCSEASTACSLIVAKQPNGWEVIQTNPLILGLTIILKFIFR